MTPAVVSRFASRIPPRTSGVASTRNPLILNQSFMEKARSDGSLYGGISTISSGL